MVITIFQVIKAKTIKDEIFSERKKLALRNTMEELKKAQPHIRQISTLKSKRGGNANSVSQNIHASFDLSISNLNVSNQEENDIRKIIKKAQKSLNSFVENEDLKDIQSCQSLIQDCISKTSNIINSEEIK